MNVNNLSAKLEKQMKALQARKIRQIKEKLDSGKYRISSNRVAKSLVH